MILACVCFCEVLTNQTEKISEMGNQNNRKGSRRWFLGFALDRDNSGDEEMVKMLTADGRLVSVKKSAIIKVSTTGKTTNKDIYVWMNNPSKEGQ